MWWDAAAKSISRSDLQELCPDLPCLCTWVPSAQALTIPTQDPQQVILFSALLGLGFLAIGTAFSFPGLIWPVPISRITIIRDCCNSVGLLIGQSELFVASFPDQG